MSDRHSPAVSRKRKVNLDSNVTYSVNKEKKTKSKSMTFSNEIVPHKKKKVIKTQSTDEDGESENHESSDDSMDEETSEINRKDVIDSDHDRSDEEEEVTDSDHDRSDEEEEVTDSDHDRSDEEEEVTDSDHDRSDEEEEVTDSDHDRSDEEEEADEVKAVKEELSNMSFEELLQLKERLGLKVYNQVVHGTKERKPAAKKEFKRENKNRPMEMSSKKPAYHSKDSVKTKKKMTRDPRFDDLSGEYNEHYFKSNYSFIFDIKAREKEKVKKIMTKEKNQEKKTELQQLYNRMDQQEKAEKQKDKRKEIEKEWKKKELSQVQQGKTPYFLKKTDLRKLELAEKYKDLQKSGKLEKYLSKKRKKTAQKEKKKLPIMS